jgi:cytochrome c oxidase subunit III
MSELLAQDEIEPTSLGVDNRKLVIWTFIASEVMFFTGLIVVYMVMRGRSVTGPFAAQVLSVPLVAINTFVLLASSFTMVTALSAIQENDLRGFKRWLTATAILGLLFLSGQAFEFISLYNAGASLSSNMFGATFFTLTGFHGMHVFVGVLWIAFVLARASRGGVTQGNHLAVELVGLYWHFVDIVWIIIFTVVYLLRM